MQEHELQTIPAPQSNQLPTLAVGDVLQQVALVQQVLREVMIEGHHYGVLPGTEAREGDKPRAPMLYKPGAEKLCMVFRLAPTFNVRTTQLPNGHREERVTCTLTHITSGRVIATADGSCSTMESKYRYRNAKPKCPSCGAEAIFKSKQEPGWFCWQKKGGCGETFGPADQRIRGQSVGLAENKDIADVWNTVLKMAVKRALVAATLLATAASDMFIVEEDGHDDDDDEPEEKPKPAKRETRSTAKAAPAPKPEPKLTPKQEMARNCAKLINLLDWSMEEVRSALAENGIVEKFERWSQLDEAQLDRALRMFEAALKAGAPAEAQP